MDGPDTGLEQNVFRTLLENRHSDSPAENAVAGELRHAVEEIADAGGELESTRAAWRNERYRLLSEIDHLRSTLDGMRGKLDQGERLQRQFQEVQCYNEELEARWKQHVNRSGAESSRGGGAKESRIDALEERVVDLLERSGNSRRDAQAVQERMKTMLEAMKRSIEMEADRRLRTSETQWMRERRNLVNEIENLKKGLARRPSFAAWARLSLFKRFWGR